MSGKPRRYHPTREAQRFAWLIVQMEGLGISQSEIARRTGIVQSHINKLRNLETSGRTGIGADIVRKVMDGLNVDPAYFFDAYEGQRDHRLYLLSAKRDEKRVSALEEANAEMKVAIAEMRAELASAKAEMARLQHDAATARRRKPTG